MKISSREDLIQFLNKIESELPVQRWKVDGLDLWPILRVQIYVKILHQIESSLGSGFSKPPPPKVKRSRLSDNRRVRKFKARLKLSKLKSVDVLMAEGAAHRSPVDGTHYSKFFDPIRQQIEQSSFIVEHSPKRNYDGMVLHDSRHIGFLDDYFDYTLLTQARRDRVERIKKLDPPSRFEELSNRLESIGIGSDIKLFQPDYFPVVANRLLDYVDIYDEILRRTSPNLVMTICYYSFPVFGLTAAANKRGIRVVEIQHGPQNEMHPAYSGWSNVPNEGYNTLPDMFWNWDSEAKRILDEWTKGTRHEAIVAGNPWVHFFQGREAKKPREKGYVLYTLQGLSLDFMLPAELIDIIKSSSAKWWLRLHPGQISFREEVRSFLTDKGIVDKVELDEASELPLPLVLENAKIHLTNFSGCTIEASEVGLHTILLDDRGRKSYGNLIERGVATYCKGLSGLPELIENNAERGEKSEIINLKEEFEKFYPEVL